MSRKIAVTLATALAVAGSPAAAQTAHEQHHPADQQQVAQEMPMHSMDMGMHQMMVLGPTALLGSAERLDLSAEQRGRLQEIQASFREAMQAVMAQATGDARAVLSEEQLELAEAQAARMSMGMMPGEGMDGMMGQMRTMMESMQGMDGMSEAMGMMRMCMSMMGAPEAGGGAPDPGGS